MPESLAEAAARTKPKLLYTIPNFQNPSGRLMTQQRRAEVLRIAVEHDFLVIEDDPYGELLYVREADTLAMKSRDDDHRVIYLGSFSKVLAPGLRCGWIVAAPELLAKLGERRPHDLDEIGRRPCHREHGDPARIVDVLVDDRIHPRALELPRHGPRVRASTEGEQLHEQAVV